MSPIDRGCVPGSPTDGGYPESFAETLAGKGLTLLRGKTTVLQVNVGLICNQTCAHCHLDAGPGRREIMTRDTMDRVAVFAESGGFEQIDITGGAPEMHPDLLAFIDRFREMTKAVMLRSNLSVLHQKGLPLMTQLRERNVHIVASFPSLNEDQTEALRGKGIYRISIETLRMLNQLGYGHPDSGPCLDLVVNPTGAFLPPSQKSLEKRFQSVLSQKWDIHFNRLLSFANVPLGRFRSWLIKSDNFQPYMNKLTAAFNPSAVTELMCRTHVSVSWDGYLYDCDFNQAAGLFKANRKTHIGDEGALPAAGEPIAVADHCFTCTAGAGFT